jgi:hypothetical protein
MRRKSPMKCLTVPGLRKAPGYRLLFGQDIVKGLPRYAEERRDFSLRPTESREYILAQDRAGMRGRDAFQEGIGHHQ